MKRYTKECWMFVRQDVRGRYGSEGTFRHMTPHIDDKKDETDVDESSDTYLLRAISMSTCPHSF